ncbi:MAG TPA: hypothetical protein VFN30_00535 [Chitinophagaceae bacterium]|nr:hypothetical protein [Chitinophagaceae bacterium]
MKYCLTILFFTGFILNGCFVSAQKVLYSPFLEASSQIRFEVIGKAGNYYWIQKSKKKSRLNSSISPGVTAFEVYDERMNFVKTISAPLNDTILKEYFVSQEKYMDQLVFTRMYDSTGILLRRYTNSGVLEDCFYLPCKFPSRMNLGDFLLVRSQDKNNTLLLGFESNTDSVLSVHSFLFNKNWHLLNYALLKDQRITKPFIQYDVVDYPLEDFSNCPVKLANSGEWLMLSSARINQSSLLFHFSANNKQAEIKEIRLPLNSTTQDICLSLNNEKREVLIGILSQYYSPLAKSVRVLHYSLDTCKILYDSLYKFKTVAATKNTPKTIYEEYFMTIPNKGFLLLKEYGRAYDSKYDPDELSQNDEFASGDLSQAGLFLNKNNYTRYNYLAGVKTLYDRGDLSLYYFSATGKDSCWSGIINKEQVTELNSATLSYVFLPAGNKLFFLYNSFYKNRDNYSSSTILDYNGNALQEGIVYWNIKNTLLFQKARQIAEGELAIPYAKNARNGFAIIRLSPAP